MENIVCNVRDIDANDRQALEQIVGQALRDNQQLLIRIAEIDVGGEIAAANGRGQSLSDWTSVYEGLSDKEVEELDQLVKTRADLTRHLP